MVLKLADIEKRRKIIIDAMRGNPNTNETILKRTHLNKDTYYKMRNGLVRDKIICKKEIGRQVWLYLPEDEARFRKIAKLDKIDVEDKEKIRLRIAHTEDIKEKVIRPWLEQMKPKKGSILLIKNVFFSGEREPLFSDFKKHLKFEPDPFYELAHLKKINKTFERRKYNLKCRVQSIISQVLEESPALFITEPERIKEFVDFRDEYDEIRANLSKWIIEVMDHRRLYLDDDIEMFDEIYLDFTSSVREKKGFYEYYVNDIYCGYKGKSDISKEEFLNKMDECIKTILKKITESEPIKNEIEQLHKINIVIEKHLKNMRVSLEKHLCLGVLPGNCEYYYWVQSKQ